MITLNTRTKQAIKTGLAMSITYGIALGMGWENPYWAGFAVAMISLSTAGQSLNKGAMRMMGTLVAATAVLIFIAWFAQDRWWFIAVLSLYLGFCTYMITGKKRTYFWWCCAFVCLVIGAHAAGDFSNTFNIAALRVQQTGMGILVYTLVSVFLWPISTRGMLDEATRKLFTTQATIYRTYRALLSGHGTAEDSLPLRMQEVQLLSQCAQALNAAETDSYEVWELRHQWRRLHHQSIDLMETLEHWRESFGEIQPLDFTKILPNIEAVLLELDERFAEIEYMLTDEAPTRTPTPVNLVVDHKEMLTHTHFQKAAVAVTKTQLDRLEMLSNVLLDCVRDIKGNGRQSTNPVPSDTPAGGFGLDPDRWQAAVRAMAATWAAFFIWFYVDPPGHATFVEFAPMLVMIAAMNRLNPTTLFTPLILGTLFAGVLYVFVMPHLSGYMELGAMIFGTTFLIYYLLWQPHQGLAKSAVIVMFLNVIGVQNQQTYDFAHYANTVAMVALACGLAVAIAYLPPSPRPEKVFLRLLARFFRHAEYLMSRLALDRDEQKKPATRWRMTLYRKDLLEIPDKLAALGRRIDNRLLSGQTPEQVQALATSLQALAYRINELVEARKSPQADFLVAAVIDDTRAWRMLAQKQFRLWADNPTLAVEPGVDVRARLAVRITGLEAQIGERLRVAGEEQLSEEDYENFYRYLGAFRGLSEAAVFYLQNAQGINWAQWEEERF